MLKAAQKSLRLLLILIIFSPSLLMGQQSKLPPPVEGISHDSLLTFAKLIVDSSTCQVLVTVDADGKPHAREMAPFPPEDDWTIWLGTYPTSNKVAQIKENPNVLVYYYDPDGLSYAAVSGKAELVNDAALKDKYWDDTWGVFFSDKATQYILIKVVPESVVVYSVRYNLLWDKEGHPLSTQFRR